ncbi:MAG: hypothetical protein KBC95_00900 [Candidatus Peribacteraceae bacterium]|nr:hypothetical protein [Candidatus Peribacteraceae bacterium]
MAQDILPFVSITEDAHAAYHDFARRVAAAVMGTGLRPDQIPEEEAELAADGGLRVYIELPQQKGRIEFIIPKGQWAWTDRN